MHVYVRGRIVTLETPLPSSLGFSSLFSVHFLTACRTARYGDQMRADRVSSIVYTLKKPLLLTSITIYFPSSSASALFLFRFSNSLSLSLSLRVSLYLSSERNCLPWNGFYPVAKDTHQCESTAYYCFCFDDLNCIQLNINISEILSSLFCCGCFIYIYSLSYKQGKSRKFLCYRRESNILL